MDVVDLIPRLHFIRLPIGHAYLWHDPDGLILIDTGLPGSGPLIAKAIRQTGHQPAELRRLVLTHFHADWEQPIYDQVMSQIQQSRWARRESTASLPTVTSSASATVPWQWPFPATHQAASRSTYPATRFCSPATPRPAAPTGQSSAQAYQR